MKHWCTRPKEVVWHGRWLDWWVVWVWCALPTTTTSVDGLVDGTMVVVVVVWNKAQDTLVINTTTPCARHGCCGVDVVFGD